MIESLTKATSKVTLTLTAAPGVGTSRTFDAARVPPAELTPGETQMALPKISDEDLLNPIKRFAPGHRRTDLSPPRSGTYRTARYPDSSRRAVPRSTRPTRQTHSPETPRKLRPPSAQPLGEGDALTSTTRLGGHHGPWPGRSSTRRAPVKAGRRDGYRAAPGAVTNIGDFAKAAATGASIIGPGGPFKCRARHRHG